MMLSDDWDERNPPLAIWLETMFTDDIERRELDPNHTYQKYRPGPLVRVANAMGYLLVDDDNNAVISSHIITRPDTIEEAGKMMVLEAVANIALGVMSDEQADIFLALMADEAEPVAAFKAAFALSEKGEQ